MRLSMEMTLSIKGIFDVEAGLGDDPHRLPEPDHQGLAGLIDGEQRSVRDDREDDRKDGDDAAGNTEPHRAPPAGGGGVCGRRCNSLSGR